MVSFPKQKLETMEQTGAYVFHGSGFEVNEFEPRQAYNFAAGENIPDGPPAIFASSALDYAILMAIIQRKNCPKGYHSSAGTHNGKLRFCATKETLDQLKEDASGWVYVFDKALFQQRDKGGIEYLSIHKVKPLDMIKVTKEDLSKEIEILK